MKYIRVDELAKEIPIVSWSWEHISNMRQALFGVMREYAGIGERLGIKIPIVPGQVILQPPASKSIEFVEWFIRDVNHLQAQLSVLDDEIARRKELVGVAG